MYDLLSVVSAIITIITAIVAIFNVTVKVEELEDGLYQIDCNNVLVCLCIVMLCCLLVCLVKVKKYGSILRNIREGFAFNYYMFLHDFRNAYFEMLRNHKNNMGQNESERLETLTKDTKTFLEGALDYLCNILQSNTGKKISACIKLIENTGQTPAIGVVSPFTQKVEHLRKSEGNQKVVGGVRVADKKEQRRFFVPQLIKLQLVIGHDLPELWK